MAFYVYLFYFIYLIVYFLFNKVKLFTENSSKTQCILLFRHVGTKAVFLG